MSLNLDAIAFDDGVRQDFVGDFGRERSGLVRFLRRQIELEVLPLPYVFDGAVAKRLERVRDGLTLRIEHRRLQRDEYARSHTVSTSQRSTQSSLNSQNTISLCGFCAFCVHR